MTESIVVTVIVLAIFGAFGIMSRKAEKEVELQRKKGQESGQKPR